MLASKRPSGAPPYTRSCLPALYAPGSMLFQGGVHRGLGSDLARGCPFFRCRAAMWPPPGDTRIRRLRFSNAQSFRFTLWFQPGVAYHNAIREQAFSACFWRFLCPIAIYSGWTLNPGRYTFLVGENRLNHKGTKDTKTALLFLVTLVFFWFRLGAQAIDVTPYTLPLNAANRGAEIAEVHPAFDLDPDVADFGGKK